MIAIRRNKTRIKLEPIYPFIYDIMWSYLYEHEYVLWKKNTEKPNNTMLSNYIEQCEYDNLREPLREAHEILRHSFVWLESPEEWEYWNKIYNRLLDAVPVKLWEKLDTWEHLREITSD